MFIEVLVELGSKTIDKAFTYLVPNEMKNKIEIGKRVLVPFGKQKVEGFILGINNKKEYDYELKSIIDVIDENPVLNKELLELGKYISEKTLCYLINAYQVMLPTALKARKNTKIGIKIEKYITLNKSTEEILRYIENNRRGEVQNQILRKLLTNKVISKKGLPITSLNTLLTKGLVKEVKKEVYRENKEEIKEYNAFVLNKDQLKVFDEIKNNLNNSITYLLHGVTGSGKTEVYMQVIDEVLKNKKKAIVLVPEISLTPQMVKRFKGRFGKRVAILHSNLSDGEKYDEWRKIEKDEVDIVVGARSAIFAPFKKLGIIIIDEEHSSTYKQENNPRYHALDIALWRSRYHKCPVVLGSATPSLESYARAKKGVYKLLALPHRVNSNPLPRVAIIDMKEEIKSGNRSIFSKLLLDKIKDKLEKEEQVILLLNRRGYTTFITCKNCGYTHKCPKCDISLTFHKRSNMMRCHYCGYATKRLEICPECKSENIKDFGSGTEKLEEELLKQIPYSKPVRMDIDTTSKKGSHKNILRDFEEGKYNILLGTQMIAKGLDFPKVTLVGVLNGDTSLNIPDFRSAERTFQLLNQVAGRAGRGDLEGEVIIQTFNPDHYSILMAKENDYIGFYEKEMKIRKELKYPPYYFLTIIRILSRNYEEALGVSKKIGEYLRNNLSEDSIVLGPSTSNLYKVNNVYRFQCIIKYRNDLELEKVLKDILEHYKESRKVSIEIDINPIKI
jgi:primosomal protein N' (replication factor Y)